MKMRVILEEDKARAEVDVGEKIRHLIPLGMEENYKETLTSSGYWKIVRHFFNMATSPGGKFDLVKPDVLEIEVDVKLHKEYFI